MKLMKLSLAVFRVLCDCFVTIFRLIFDCFATDLGVHFDEQTLTVEKYPAFFDKTVMAMEPGAIPIVLMQTASFLIPNSSIVVHNPSFVRAILHV